MSCIHACGWLAAKPCGDLLLAGDAGDARRGDDIGCGGVGVADGGERAAFAPTSDEERRGEDIACTGGIPLLDDKRGNVSWRMCLLINVRSAWTISDDKRGDLCGPCCDHLIWQLAFCRRRHILDAADEDAHMRQYRVGATPGHGVDTALGVPVP